jgi:hypothetical protein
VDEYGINLTFVFFYQSTSISKKPLTSLYSLYMDLRALTFGRVSNSINWRLRRFYNLSVQIFESRKFSHQLSLEELLKAQFRRNDVYRYFQKAFRVWSPKWVREHRAYFANNGRGFGEDAFHAAWLLVLCEYKPVKMLEIGVYRGQTISLWALVGEKFGLPQEILGISPMDSSGDAVSHYESLDYASDIQSNFEHFNLPNPKILKSYSTDSEALKVIENGDWDLVYIDGSHAYDVVKSDINAATKGLLPGGILVLDDSSLFTDFNLPTKEGFRGHPGPSKVFEEIDLSEFEFLFGVGHNNFLRKK